MHNRRQRTRRKLWEVKEYKDCELHISDSDDEKEEKTRTKYQKKYTMQIGKNTFENWISCGSGFDCSSSEGLEIKDFKSNDTVCSSQEENLIETTSSSDNDAQNLQPSINEVSCNSRKSAYSSHLKQCDYQDFCDDSSDCLSSTAISDITESSQSNFQSSDQVRDTSYKISPPSSPMGSTSCNTKGSEWILTIPWQSRNQDKTYPENEFDSAKKNKKYICGGFADQLHRLQSREKSAKAFWNNCSDNDNSKNLSDGKGSMILELTEITHACGTVTCRANLLKSCHLKELDLLHSSVNYIDIDTNLDTSNLTKEGMSENYIVFVDSDQYENLNLSAGSIVQLFPPWKVLHVTNLNAPVLLCTYYLQVVKRADQLLRKKHQKQDYEVT